MSLLDKEPVKRAEKFLKNPNKDFFVKKRAIFRESILGDKLYEDTGRSLAILLSWYRDLLESKFIMEDEQLLNIDRKDEILILYNTLFS